MKQTLAILLIGLIALPAFSWENGWKKSVQKNSDGTVSLNILNSGGSTVTKTTLTECPDGIYHTFSSLTVAEDTVILPKGCITSNSIWTADCWEGHQDSSYSGTFDYCGVEKAGDTLFFRKSTSGTSVDYGFFRRVR